MPQAYQQIPYSQLRVQAPPKWGICRPESRLAIEQTRVMIEQNRLNAIALNKMAYAASENGAFWGYETESRDVVPPMRSYA